jgi:hypothetical protein
LNAGSVTLVSGHLGGVRCGLSGTRPGPNSQDWSARPTVADRGCIGAAQSMSTYRPMMPVGGGQLTMIGSRSGDGRRRAGS